MVDGAENCEGSAVAVLVGAVQFWDKVVDLPVVVKVVGRRQKTVEVPQLLSDVQVVHFLDKVIDLPVVQIVDVEGQMPGRESADNCGGVQFIVKVGVKH